MKTGVLYSWKIITNFDKKGPEKEGKLEIAVKLITGFYFGATTHFGSN